MSTKAKTPTVNDLAAGLAKLTKDRPETAKVIDDHVLVNHGMPLADLIQTNEVKEDAKFETLKEIIVAYQNEQKRGAKAETVLSKPNIEIMLDEDAKAEVAAPVKAFREAAANGTAQGLSTPTKTVAVDDPLTDRLRGLILELIGSAPAAPDIGAIVREEINAAKAEIVAQVKADLLKGLA